ncbi:DUF6098 family protein [Lysobacter korlensis]|uniref:DUF6098 family protein n=1 Tax=Lysobacter korlensis TaxID=553636 RepID=A0ABV6S0G8_9GAMM
MLDRLEQLEELVAANPDLHVRYSEGFEKDVGSGSLDTESGLQLPGLSVNPLNPEPWWTRPVRDWLARQLCQYKHLQEQNPHRHAWVLRGRMVARGPDCEPLLADVEQVDQLSDSLLSEAERVYQERFARGQGPED